MLVRPADPFCSRPHKHHVRLLMRVLQAGALLAAEHYKDDLPEDWLEQVKKLDEYKELADKLVSQRAIISILPP